MNENEEAQYMIDVRNAAEYLLARGVPQNEIIPYIERRQRMSWGASYTRQVKAQTLIGLLDSRRKSRRN